MNNYNYYYYPIREQLKRRPSSSWHREASLDSLAPPIVPRQRERIKLAQVKSNLYNPILPTLRRYDMDDVICKLADEHHRHTSYLTKNEFENPSEFFTSLRRNRKESAPVDVHLVMSLNDWNREELYNRAKTADEGLSQGHAHDDMRASFDTYRRRVTAQIRC